MDGLIRLDPRRDAAASAIRTLRTRLLDLTAHNPLISTSHKRQTGTRTNVRAVNGHLNRLFEAIKEGRTLAVRSLPQPVDDPDDERTEAFRAALESARATDEEYRAATRTLADDEMASAKAARIERHLRDRVREALTLPPRKKDATPRGLSEYAESLGINPSFELAPTPEHLSGHEPGEAVDFQTLMLPDPMQGTLAKIREIARTLVEETGVSTLHLAFGFLEWFESESSDRPLTSPLLLMRVDIDREIARSHYRYSLTGAGDEAQPNLTLAERLSHDFGIKIPAFSEHDTPEAYLERVRTEVSQGRAGWTVYPWVTLGHFPFARLAMFSDLSEDLWTAAGGLADHPLIGRLLGGGESGLSSFAEEHDVDAPEVAAKVPALMLEADASQHSAVYDVMSGKNLVIEGPPGTGKSQTITNIIAAALANGKRVLFVADKLAALQVVKDRLDKLGLGDFCLELHSGKARKKDVVDALRRRVQRRPVTMGFHALDGNLRELAATRTALTRYVSTLNSPLGAFGATVHDILWGDRRRREDEGDLARSIDQISLPGCETLTRTDIERRRSVLDHFEQAAAPVLSRFGNPTKHPWFGVTRSDLPSIEIEQVVRDVADLAAAIDTVDEAVSGLRALGVECGMSLHEVQNVSGTLSELSIPSVAPADLYHAMASPLVRTAAQERLAACQTYRQIRDDLRTKSIACDPELGIEAANILSRLWDDLQTRLSLRLTIADLPGKSAELRAEAARLVTLGTVAADIYRLFGLSYSGSLKDLAMILEAVALVSDAGTTVISSVTSAFFARENREVIASAAADISALNSRAESLTAEYSISPSIMPDVLRHHASILLEAGVFSFLNSRVRHAKRTYAELSRSARKPDLQGMCAELRAVAEHLEAVATLEAKREYQVVFGSLYRGLATETGRAAAVADWAARVPVDLVGTDDITSGARHVLLSGDQDRLHAILAYSSRKDVAALRAYVLSKSHNSLALKNLIVEIEATASKVAALTEACKHFGVPATTEITALPSLCGLLTSVNAASDEARTAVPLRRALPTRALSALEDHAPFEVALALAQAVAELPVPSQVTHALHHIEPVRLATVVIPAAQRAAAVITRALEQWQSLQRQLVLDDVAFFGRPVSELTPAEATARLRRASSCADELGAWITYLIERGNAGALRLDNLLALWDERNLPGSLSLTFDRVLYRALGRVAFANHPELDRFTGLSQDEARARFKALDSEATELRRQILACELSRRQVSPGNGVGRKSEYTEHALIMSEIGKQKRHIPLRQLFDRAGHAIQALKPCFMMSPLSVAQFLKPNGPRFDLLVIDEASQMRPEDAVGAIARSDQIVVVGDPKQLPPTSFFSRNSANTEDDDIEEEQVDSESILDLAQTAFRPMRRLRWHYRSRHGSLIAFSNREFYDDDLIVFPSPAEADPAQGVALVKVDGIYKSRSNIVEVDAVCSAVIRHMQSTPERSLGVATMNQVQRDLIEQRMDQLAATHSEVEEYRTRWRDTLERFFVKNLENVQGDERDVIFISTVFGPPQPGGKVLRGFGPLNGATGHRRLNVLFTRAKHHVRVFTSMTPADILAGPQSSRGVHVLQKYLAYAADGRLDAGEETGREPDSDFEIFVRERLQAAGYEAVPQVGVAGFFIDLAVRHPDVPSRFLLGIECDGAAYHSSKSARDRDILRQKVLEGLGWTIYRIWSTDWFRDPAGQTQKLLAFIEKTAGNPGLLRRAISQHDDSPGQRRWCQAPRPAAGQPSDPSGPGRLRNHHDQSCGSKENGSLCASSRAAHTGQ